MTGDGIELDLALDGRKGIILYETEGAYVYADAYRYDESTGEHILTKDELEAVAEMIHFDVLAKRYDGRDNKSIAKAVADLAASNQ